MNTHLPPEQILRRLEWRIIRRLDGLFQGDYRTLFYGSGIDFADLREYQAQDDIRHIDWNVTARMNQLHVRQYTEDRELTAWFLLDLSPSMGFGPAEQTKQAMLVDLTATLARLLTRDGNRVGAILYTDRVAQIIPPRTGRNQVLLLTRRAPGSQPSTQPGPTTDLSPSAARRTQRRATPLADLCHLRLHQPARLGEHAGAAPPASRADRHAPAWTRPSMNCPTPA